MGPPLSYERKAGRASPPPSPASSRWLHRARAALEARRDLVEGRVGHLVGLHLGRAFNHLLQALQHCRIGVAAIGVRALFPIPHADRQRFGAVWGDECELVLETVLLPKH